MVKIKICGITNEDDALRAAELGADYVGFLVEISFSEDSITREKAKDIIKLLKSKISKGLGKSKTLLKKLPLEVKPVMVTYLDKANKIIKLAEEINPEIIQLHNPKINLNEIGKIRRALPKIEITKAIHIKDNLTIEQAKRFENYVDYILLDTKTKDKLGGTGKTHNWDISRKIVKSVKCKVFLAGGLNPDNVKEAIKKVKPFAVDTNSGVKAKPRIKDIKKLKEFIQSAK